MLMMRVAKDLIEWMINKDPAKRPKGGGHAGPHHTSGQRRGEWSTCEKLWKSKIPPELMEKLDGKKKAYPDNTLGLLRFIRNLHEHYTEDADCVDMMKMFPDLFGCVYKFAKKRDWNSRSSLKKMFDREDLR
ncbi:hypothetical protein J4Q44_G00349750 [Coregonus suidteri]|uniref:KEN domain-containing protein n=1 Tax=Coregonus suidteri TaxID=861788 RepID=A0AAN8KY53_9TELE